MNIDVYSSTGSKKGTLALPDALFAAPINRGLMHQAVIRQQANRRQPIAHAKSRGEVRGSTAKLFAQKGTGRARRGSIRSPLLRGGGKAFGPKSKANFVTEMPRAMRTAALLGCLSYQAKKGTILGLESYPETIKTKTMMDLLKKLPVQIGRKIVLVVPEKHNALSLSTRNIPGVQVLLASYLNPVDVLNARSLIFVGDAVQKAEEVFGRKKERVSKRKEEKEAEEEEEEKEVKKKKKATVRKKKSSSSSHSSSSSDS